jgi:CDP-diacylglycerol--glycerol-3-phosphate 3-phosphatidyltransferase
MFNFIQLLTYFRIISAPIIFLLIVILHSYGWALILFIFASSTDYWDGYLARKYNFKSVLGEVLDPIADKILITFLIIALILELSSVFVGFVGGFILIREFWVAALRDFNARQDRSEATMVTFLAKIKTTVQLIAFGGFLLGLFLQNALIIFVANFFLFLALIITIQTGLSYTIATFKR